MPVPVDHSVLDKVVAIIRCQTAINGCRRIERMSECVEFTDDDGDWEIVVRPIEGGRDDV